jgi:hypothetical protein
MEHAVKSLAPHSSPVTTPRLWRGLLVALLSAALTSQHLPLPGGDQQVAVFDVGFLVATPATDAAPTAGRDVAARQDGLHRFVATLRTFGAAGAFGADAPADLQPLGDRHVVALGSAAQVAACERFFAASRAAGRVLFQLDVRICQVTAAHFDRTLANVMTPLDARPGATADAHLVAVLAPATTATVQQALVGDPDTTTLQAPRLVVQNLHHAAMSSGEPIAYVRDFELETVAGAQIANPIVDSVWHGQEIEATCAALDDGTVLVQMAMLDQTVERPLAEFATTVPGTRHACTVQVPRITGTRASQTARLACGGTAVTAARRADGTWLVTLTTVHRVAPEPVPTERR